MTGGDGKTTACSICHGPALKGLGEVPGITGRPAIYIFRQLNDMKTGNRSGGVLLAADGFAVASGDPAGIDGIASVRQAFGWCAYLRCRRRIAHRGVPCGIGDVGRPGGSGGG